jgi:hypothetical protein
MGRGEKHRLSERGDKERGSRYLRKKSAGTKEGDEMPVAEPLCQLDAAVGIASAGALLTWLHVWCTEFVE